MLRPTYAYRFGSAEFDTTRYELKVGGLPVEVERRVLDLLAYLLEHAGEVVTKEELLREVWAGRITVDKVLPNAMTKLRRALGAENAARITTQARIGYRLDGTVSRIVVGRHTVSAGVLQVGAAVPGRSSFVLDRRLGAREGSEVWLALHAKTRVPRVYKFALDSQHLRSLQRETTLLRVLHEGLPDHRCFVSLVDWNFQTAPYFLECEYGGEDLRTWASQHLAGYDSEGRIALFLQIADAVDAAHALGVLHKDIKPGNVLVSDGPAGPVLRLTDFGSARMLEPQRLEQLGITRQGLTHTADPSSDTGSGTPLYLAPEVYAGQPPTLRSDVYALGVLLYQLLTGRLREPMATGWEHAIDDVLVREDLALATAGDPAQRIHSAASLAERLRSRPQRRAEAERQRLADTRAAHAHAALARSRARRPLHVALLVSLVLGLLVSFVLLQSARQARRDTAAELARANAMLGFLEEDLISRANPMILGKGAQAPIKEVLLAARARLATRFQDQPLTDATLRLSLAGLFNTLDLWTEGEHEAQLALASFERELGPHSTAALRARALRIGLLSRMARFEEAQQELTRLAQPRSAAGPSTADHTALHRFLLAQANSTFHLTRGAMADALPYLREAIAAHDALQHPSHAMRDSLMLDLLSGLSVTGATAEALQQYDTYTEALAARPGDTRILGALAQLAVARSLSLEGQHERAKALLLQAQSVIVEQLGPEHTRHLSLLNELLGVYFRQADWARALPIARELHDQLRRKLGEAHNMTWVSLGNLGRTLYEAGHFEEARSRLQDAHQHLVAMLGEHAPQAQDVAFVWVAAEIELGQTAAAQALLERLDPAQLEQSQAGGHWPAALQIQRGLLARLAGDSAAAKQQLAAGLAAFRDDPKLHRSRLLRTAVATHEQIRLP